MLRIPITGAVVGVIFSICLKFIFGFGLLIQYVGMIMMTSSTVCFMRYIICRSENEELEREMAQRRRTVGHSDSAELIESKRQTEQKIK